MIPTVMSENIMKHIKTYPWYEVTMGDPFGLKFSGQMKGRGKIFLFTGIEIKIRIVIYKFF